VEKNSDNKLKSLIEAKVNSCNYLCLMINYMDDKSSGMYSSPLLMNRRRYEICLFEECS